MTMKFTALEIEIAQEMLTELLVHEYSNEGDRALAWKTLADGVAAILDPEMIERSKLYARYRVPE